MGAVTHVDGTARVHAVDRDVNPRYWRLLAEFESLTGVPVLLNTSFNNHAEPIGDSVTDALRCFLTTHIDHLVVDDLVISMRLWTLQDLGELVPSLVPAAVLRREEHAGRQPRHTVAFTHLDNKDFDIDAEVYDALRSADGHTPLRELGNCGDYVLAETLRLWGERCLSLWPLPARP